MIAENAIDNDNKIVRRTMRGEINTGQALKLVQDVSLAVNLNRGYDILVDIRDTSFYTEMSDLFEIASECSRRLAGFNRRIAIVIPNKEHRKRAAKLFRACMEVQGFEIKQFIEYDAAKEWLANSTIDNQSRPDPIQEASQSRLVEW